MVQSVEAWQKQISLQNCAKDHKELETALKFFGT
jgi:ribulose 1,5-bisphosphate carboxylase large subunit-like protein